MSLVARLSEQTIVSRFQSVGNRRVLRTGDPHHQPAFLSKPLDRWVCCV